MTSLDDQNAKIEEYLQDGVSVEQVSLLFGIDPAHVQNIAETLIAQANIEDYPDEYF